MLSNWTHDSRLRSHFVKLLQDPSTGHLLQWSVILPLHDTKDRGKRNHGYSQSATLLVCFHEKIVSGLALIWLYKQIRGGGT